MDFPRPSQSAGSLIGGIKDRLGFNKKNDRDEYYLQKDINIGVAVLRKEILIDRTDTATNVLWSDSESFYIGERLFYTGNILSINGG